MNRFYHALTLDEAILLARYASKQGYEPKTRKQREVEANVEWQKASARLRARRAKFRAIKKEDL